VYEEEFGVFGGAPFGALIGDYEFGKSGRTSSCSRRSPRWRPRRTRRS
jgi:type VI secretion system protein ImpC